ncbi:MAG: FecR domain-containing protein [Thermodesulfobacteriota bacterium]
MRKAIRLAALIGYSLAAALLLPPIPAVAAGEPVGFIKNAAGSAFVVRDGERLPAGIGTKLQVGDTLVTGEDGSLGAIFRDDSTLSLGPGSSVVVRNFEFQPDQGKFGLFIRITRGSLAYLSGLIGKLSPESARFETPTTTIGIRGTHFAVKTGEPIAR